MKTRICLTALAAFAFAASLSGCAHQPKLIFPGAFVPAPSQTVGDINDVEPMAYLQSPGRSTLLPPAS